MVPQVVSPIVAHVFFDIYAYMCRVSHFYFLRFVKGMVCDCGPSW